MPVAVHKREVAIRIKYDRGSEPPAFIQDLRALKTFSGGAS